MGNVNKCGTLEYTIFGNVYLNTRSVSIRCHQTAGKTSAWYYKDLAVTCGFTRTDLCTKIKDSKIKNFLQRS